MKFRNFTPALTNLKEFMFVQLKGNKLECFEVNIIDYDNKDSKTIKGVVLEAKETKDEILFTKKEPIESIDIDRNLVEAILLS